jgi:hypothetical protein
VPAEELGAAAAVVAVSAVSVASPTATPRFWRVTVEGFCFWVGWGSVLTFFKDLTGTYGVEGLGLMWFGLG